MALNLPNAIIDCLQQNPGRRHTAREIANWIFKKFPNECREKKERSASIRNDGELVRQIRAEIGSHRPRLQKRYPQFKATEERPRKYYWGAKAEEAESIEVEDVAADAHVTREVSSSESDLYPVLCAYLWSESQVYPKRIDERKSSNTRGPKGNKWLYPDLVGMEDLISHWHDEVRNVIEQYADRKVKLWSFEVKLQLTRSNVREAFFQATSNSSWANFGYLVTKDILGNHTMSELRMLSSLHGIGLIQLDAENPRKSQILIPARERTEVDWATCNRLAGENQDFLEFLKLIRQFHQTGDPRKRDWDIPKGV